MKPKINNRVLGWVWKDCILRYKTAHLKNVFLDVLVVGTQVAAYGLLYQYAKALEKNQTIELLSFVINPRSSRNALLLISGGAGIIFLFSGVVQYYAQLFALSIARKYETFCSQRLLAKLNECQHPHLLFVPGPYQIDLRLFRKSMIKDTRYYGKTSLTVSKSVLAFLKLVVSMIIMVKIHLMISIVIVGLGIPALFLLKRSGKKVIDMTKLKESRLPAFVNAKKQNLRDILDTNMTQKDDLAFNEMYSKKEINLYYNAYYGIKENAEQNGLISQVFIAIFTVSILLLGGNLVLGGYMNWSIFIAYMLVLKFFFSSFNSFATIIRKSSKFYDYLSSYLILIQKIEKGSERIVANGVPNYEDSTKNSDFLSLFLDDDDDEDDDDDDL